MRILLTPFSALTALLILLSVGEIWAQAPIGGRHVFEFINLPQSGRAQALGDYFITTSDGDLSAAYHNPATLSSQAVGQAAFNYDFFVSDIKRGGVAYGFESKKWHTNFHSGLQFVNYGEFKQTDNIGNVQGTFDVKEYALTLGASRDLYERVRLGVNTRIINSNYESYTSWGLTFDLAAYYHDDENNAALTLVIKNAGFQLTPFVDERESVPFDVQLGYSKRLKYLPFRFSVVAHHLHEWDIVYDDPNNKPTQSIFTNNQAQDNTGFVEDLFRHLVFAGEMSVGKKENLQLRLAYNHLRSKELKLNDFRTMAGFSFGFGLKLGKFSIDYGLGRYYTQASASHFTLRANLGELFGKEEL